LDEEYKEEEEENDNQIVEEAHDNTVLENN
jgi:hypothetical protein